MQDQLDVDIRQIAKDCILQAERALSSLRESLDDDFERSVNCLYQCPGRIILTGIGKSALIAQKITATLNSTGSSAIFLHAADALHGDMGVIREGDVVWALSQSGESPEIRQLAKAIRGFGNPLIAMTGNRESALARAADFVLETQVSQEADPNNLAPTTSTTTQLVLGDAVAISLQQLHGFEARDFARIHPGGSLGKRLLLTMKELVRGTPPVVDENETMDKTLLKISASRKGAVGVVDAGGHLLGIITDGDLRRHIADLNPLDAVKASRVMTPQPITVQESVLAVDALKLMKEKRISQILVLDGDRLTGLVHIHELLEQGLHSPSKTDTK